MRKALIALCFCMTSLNVSAANESFVYTELWIGQSNLDVRVKPSTLSIGRTSVNNLSGSLTYDDPTYYGIEVGASKFAGSPLRVGVFFQTAEIDLKKASGSGTASDGTTTVDLAVNASGAQLRGVGLDFDNHVRLFGVNSYYDFNQGSKFRPFFGVGLGQADIQNARSGRFFGGMNLGFNYDISKNAYLGVRLSNYWIDGPTDELGLNYGTIKVNNYGLHWGYRRY